MTLEALFAIYYTLYRTEADTPNTSDDEFIIFKALTTEAITRWANYDNTFWKELYQTLQVEQDGDLTVTLGTTDYNTPANMRIAGGYIRLFDDNGTTKVRIPIIEPQEAQFKSDTTRYAFFTGDPQNGFTLHLNPEPDEAIAGLNMDYVYYKIPDTLDTVSSLPQMTQPMFIVHRCLANRFRGSRNPYYQTAKNDAEDVLRTMQLENNSGNWSNPWKLADNSSGRFGV